MSCGIGRGRGSDPELLWLWLRPVATAAIRSLTWEPPHDAGPALKKQKTKKKKKKVKGDNPNLPHNTGLRNDLGSSLVAK